MLFSAFAGHASVPDGQTVIDVGDAGRCPGGGHGRVVLVPGPDGSGESDGAVGASDRDVVRFDLGAAFECLDDGLLDVLLVGAGHGEVYVVLEAGDSRNVARDEFGLVTLVLPLGDAAEGDVAVLDGG